MTHQCREYKISLPFSDLQSNIFVKMPKDNFDISLHTKAIILLLLVPASPEKLKINLLTNN